MSGSQVVEKSINHHHQQQKKKKKKNHQLVSIYSLYFYISLSLSPYSRD